MRNAFPRIRPAGRLVLAVLLAAGWSAASFAVESWDTPDAKWRQGPVKYLLTKQEEQAYKKLKTDDARQKFVDEFWARRDPTPGTPENEYRDEFYRLARDAAARFSEEGGKGWQDDRGRVYILLGPPDEVTKGGGLLSAGLGSSAVDDQQASTDRFGGRSGGDTRPDAPVKTIKFIYHHSPLGGDQPLELNFTGDVTGGYRLDDKLDWDLPALRGLAPLPRRAAQAPQAPAADAAAPTPPPVAIGGEEAPPALAVPEAPVSTPQSDLMDMVRSASDLNPTIPLDVTINFYKAQDKSTFATLTLEVKRASLSAASDPDALIISAEVLNPDTGESVQRFFQPGQFGGFEGNPSAGINDTLLYQAERPLSPGKYKAIFAIKDPQTGEIGKLEKDLDVPSFDTEGLSLSTVTLAREIKPATEIVAEDSMTPFLLGKTHVVPRPDNIYKPGEELSFYYQVYNATRDPVTDYPKLDLSYAFEKNIAGKWRMVGGRPVVTPGATGLVFAYTIPMRGWPPGDYRVSIKVTDALAGTQAAQPDATAASTAPPEGQQPEPSTPAAGTTDPAQAGPASAGPTTAATEIYFTIKGSAKDGKAKSKG